LFILSLFVSKKATDCVGGFLFELMSVGVALQAIEIYTQFAACRKLLLYMCIKCRCRCRGKTITADIPLKNNFVTNHKPFFFCNYKVMQILKMYGKDRSQKLSPIRIG
jgi:hypothetical protein